MKRLLKALNLLLLVWLSVAVPTSAVASLVNRGHCQARQEASGDPTAMVDHSMHAQHGSMAMSTAPSLQSDELATGCGCGCNCIEQHCSVGLSSLATGLSHAVLLFVAAGNERTLVGAGALTSAHHLDLLRPPSLI